MNSGFVSVSGLTEGWSCISLSKYANIPLTVYNWNKPSVFVTVNGCVDYDHLVLSNIWVCHCQWWDRDMVMYTNHIGFVTVNGCVDSDHLDLSNIWVCHCQWWNRDMVMYTNHIVYTYECTLITSYTLINSCTLNHIGKMCLSMSMVSERYDYLWACITVLHKLSVFVFVNGCIAYNDLGPSNNISYGLWVCHCQWSLGEIVVHTTVITLYTQVCLSLSVVAVMYDHLRYWVCHCQWSVEDMAM